MNERNKPNGTFTEPVYMALNDEIDFENALSQAINEGLASISTIVAPVLRAYLDDAVTYEIGRMKSKSTIKDVRTLQKGLEKMFGFGAKVFEKKILEALYTKLSLSLETRQNLSFLEAVKKAKQAFDSKTRKNKKYTSGKHRPYIESDDARKG
jgi:hypothetical protein